MTWTLYKEIRYAADGIPDENLTDFPKLVSITADADIASELSGGGGVKFTSADGNTDLAFGLYPSTDLANGTVLARVKVTLLTAANVGDVIARLYYSSTESTSEDKAGTVSNDYALFMPLEEDPSGSAPQMRDWVTDTLLGTSVGSMTGGDLVPAQVGNGLEFDGANDAIDCGDVELPLATFTIEVNVNKADNADFDYIISKRAGANGYNIFLNDSGGTSKTISMVDGGGTIRSTGLSLDFGVMRHVAVTVNNTSLIGYLDGTAGSPVTITDFDAQNDVDLRIGTRSSPSSAHWFNGIIDEVKLSEVVRSANWLAFSHTDDFDNGDTFSLGTEQGDAGSSVSPDAVAINWTPVAPLVSLSRSVDPVGVDWTPVAPTAQAAAETEAGPVAVNWTPIAPDLSVSLSVDPVGVDWTPVAPAVQAGLVVSPAAVGIDWTPIAPDLSLSLAVSPVAMNWTPVAPEILVTTTAAAVPIAWTPIAPDVSLGTTLSAVETAWTVIAPALSLSLSVSPVEIEWTVVVPTPSFEAGETPAGVWNGTVRPVQWNAADRPATWTASAR